MDCKSYTEFGMSVCGQHVLRDAKKQWGYTGLAVNFPFLFTQFF